MMKLNAPTKLSFLIAVVLGVVALISAVIPVPFVSEYSFWVLAAAFGVLVAGVTLKNF